MSSRRRHRIRSLATTSVAAFAAALVAPSIQAQDSPAAPAARTADFRGFASLGYTGGGDKLGTYVVDTRYGDEDLSIRAGTGADIRVGFDYRVAPAWAVQASLGYHADRISAINGSATFRRYPLDVTASFHLPGAPVRLGVGARKPLSPRFRESGAAGNTNLDLSSSVSPLVYVEYVGSRWGVKLQGSVAEKYEIKGVANKFDGNHIGLYGSFYF
jgi:hypothetical protein